MRIALIGATGLVGSALAPVLLREGHEVEALVRRPTARVGAAGWREHVAEAGHWPALVRKLRPDAAISALGTTMRKAGSEAGFRAVDRDMVVAFAQAAREAGASRFATVSSVGADPRSRNFYLGIKAEMEQALGELGFDRLDIFRPGLLRGERGADRRLKERLAIRVSPLVDLVLRGPLDRFAAIDADLVAAAIAASLRDERPGRFVRHNREIRALARG